MSEPTSDYCCTACGAFRPCGCDLAKAGWFDDDDPEDDIRMYNLDELADPDPQKEGER